MTTIKQSLFQATEALQKTSDTARLDAELLMMKILKCSRTYLFSHNDTQLTPIQQEHFLALITRRADGEPIAYITGTKSFWTLDLNVTHATLIPRPETELLVEICLGAIKHTKAPIVYDLGTGSGAIACAIASERADCQVIASDISDEALNIAKLNQQKYKLNNLKLIKSNWLDDFPTQPVDFIISNPPYIAKDCELIETAVAKYQPAQALFSNQAGYADLFTIANQAKTHLKPGGKLLMEHGIDQAQSIKEFLALQDYTDIAHHHDLQGIARCISAKLTRI